MSVQLSDTVTNLAVGAGEPNSETSCGMELESRFALDCDSDKDADADPGVDAAVEITAKGAQRIVGAFGFADVDAGTDKDSRSSFSIL